MGKPSRRQRKQLRGKRGRPDAALLHGARANGGEASAARLGSEGIGQQVERAPSTPLDEPGGSSSWPMSVKLLLAGILALIAIGLYRRYTEDSGARDIGSPEPAVRATPAPVKAPAEPPAGP